MARYLVLNGLNYPDGMGGEKRAEIGDYVDDLPESSIPWLLEQGHIEGMQTEEGTMDNG